MQQAFQRLGELNVLYFLEPTMLGKIGKGM